MVNWNEIDCKRIGRSIVTFMRQSKSAKGALDAWIKHYPQLGVLFEEVDGFHEFISVIANNSLRDNRMGMAFRVSVGAVLSTIDASTDLYVISTYYESTELLWQANALLAMITLNMLSQLIAMLGQYSRQSWTAKLKEALICLTFLRPAVDAYRVSTFYEDSDSTVDSLTEMMFNKGVELATER